MKKEKRWVYYCDFCKKSGRSAVSMARHEKSCTMNPDRVCRMCKYSDGTPQAKMENLLKAVSIAEIMEKVEWHGTENMITVIIEKEKEAIEKLREVASNCPACMLAAIRQYANGNALGFSSFDFKKEKEKFWQVHNELQRDKDYG